MGTKNIARTAIEGGRYWGNALERRLSTRAQRARTGAWVRRVGSDPDPAGAGAPARAWLVPSGHVPEPGAPVRYRQDRRLCDEEVRFWRTLLAERQAELTA